MRWLFDPRFQIGAFVVVALIVPWLVPNEYYLRIVVLSYIFAIAAYGLNVILGYTGLLSLGHAGFFGIGAYTVALLTTRLDVGLWPALAAALAVSVVSGYIVGWICLRSRGHYFAIFTLAVGMIIHEVIRKWKSLTGGNVGVSGIPGLDEAGPVPLGATGEYYLVLVFLLAAMAVAYRLLHSMLGHTLIAIRDNEALAASAGINVMRNKRLAFMLTTALAGIAGGLYAAYNGYLGPQAASVEITFFILLYLLVGGVASISGPLVGTLVVFTLTQTLQVFEEYRMAIFGPILVLIVVFLPGGIAGVLRTLRARFGVAERGVRAATVHGER